MKSAELIHLRDGAVVVVSGRNSGIDFSGRVGIRDVDCADGREIAQEGQGLAVGGQVHGQFRFRGEAGDHLIAAWPDATLGAVGDFGRRQKPAERSDLVEKDLGSDAEVTIHGIVVKNVRIGAAGNRGYRRRAVGWRAIRRQNRLPGFNAAGVDVYAAGNRQVVRKKRKGESVVVVVRAGGLDAHQSHD